MDELKEFEAMGRYTEILLLQMQKKKKLYLVFMYVFIRLLTAKVMGEKRRADSVVQVIREAFLIIYFCRST